MATDLGPSWEEELGGDHGHDHSLDLKLDSSIDPNTTEAVGAEEKEGEAEVGHLHGTIASRDALQPTGLSEERKEDEKATVVEDDAVERPCDDKRVERAEKDAKTNIEENDALDATSDEDIKAKSEDTKHVTEDEKQVSEVVASVTSHSTPKKKKATVKKNAENVDTDGLPPPPSPTKSKRKRSLGTFVNNDIHDDENSDDDEDDAGQLQKRMRYTAVGDSVSTDAFTTDKEAVAEVPKEPEANAEVVDEEEQKEETKVPEPTTPQEPATVLPVVPADNDDVSAQPAPVHIDVNAIVATPEEPATVPPVVPADNNNTALQPAPVQINVNANLATPEEPAAALRIVPADDDNAVGQPDLAHIDVDARVAHNAGNFGQEYVLGIATFLSLLNEQFPVNADEVGHGQVNGDPEELQAAPPAPLDAPFAVIADEGGHGLVDEGVHELQAAPFADPNVQLPVLVNEVFHGQVNGGLQQLQAAPPPVALPNPQFAAPVYEGGLGPVNGIPQGLQAAALAIAYGDLPMTWGGEHNFNQVNGGLQYIGPHGPQAAFPPFQHIVGLQEPQAPFDPFQHMNPPVLQGGGWHLQVNGDLVQVGVAHNHHVVAQAAMLAADNIPVDQPIPAPQHVNVGVAPADVMPAAEAPAAGGAHQFLCPCPMENCPFVFDEIRETAIGEHFIKAHKYGALVGTEGRICTFHKGAAHCTESLRMSPTLTDHHKSVGRHLTRAHIPWGKNAYPCRVPGCDKSHATAEKRVKCRMEHGFATENARRPFKQEDDQIKALSVAHNRQFDAPVNGH